MTPKELEQFCMWMQLHTALGRISLAELRAAFERAETEGGYVVSKSQPAPTGAANG